MGYYEQIGEDNRRRAERRAKLPAWRRIDWLAVFAFPASIALIALTLYSAWRGVFG